MAVDFFGNITQLADLNISTVRDFIIAWGTNLTVADGNTLCESASDLLPLTNISSLGIEAVDQKIRNGAVQVTVNPATLDIGFLNLQSFAREVFPSPLNGSTAGDMVTWWRNATVNDSENTKGFLSAIVNKCATTYCQHRHITIGNPDIVGIGMIVAVSMLFFLAILFSILSLGPITNIVSRPSGKRHFSFRQACIGTVDELFSAVYVFAISVLVSTFAYRYRTDSRFDVLMADGLSLCCSTTVIMLAATYWAHNKERPHATASFIVTIIITMALFATHFSVASKRASPVELACGIGKGIISVTKGDPFDMRLFRFIPIGFASWCLALIGAVFHHPIIHSRRPAPESRVKLWFWKFAESLACVFGIIGLAIYAVYFFNTWKAMKTIYGEAFTSAEKQWGFGQYLAVFTWLPPILTFIHLYFAGLKGMLEARLPKGWKVYRDDNHEEDHYSNFGFKRVNTSGVEMVVDESGGQGATRSSSFNVADSNKTVTRTTEIPLTPFTSQPNPPVPAASRRHWTGNLK